MVFVPTEIILRLLMSTFNNTFCHLIFISILIFEGHRHCLIQCRKEFLFWNILCFTFGLIFSSMLIIYHTQRNFALLLLHRGLHLCWESLRFKVLSLVHHWVIFLSILAEELGGIIGSLLRLDIYYGRMSVRQYLKDTRPGLALALFNLISILVNWYCEDYLLSLVVQSDLRRACWYTFGHGHGNSSFLLGLY